MTTPPAISQRAAAEQGATATHEHIREQPRDDAGVEVIINASAGTDDKDGAKRNIEEAFTACGLEAHVSLAHGGEEITELARRAVEQDARIVVAGGGDGTVNAVASELVGTKAALGVLPLGTLNHFAKDLGIPLTLADAARNVLEGRAASVDVGEVNGHVFINNSSLGLYPRIVRRREKLQERLGRGGKWPAFFWAALSVLRRYPFLNVRLSADGEDIARRTPFVFVGNNEYQMESFNIGGRACLDAGHLSLYVTHRTGRWGLLRLAVRALFGRLREAKDFEATCAKEIWVETHKPKRMPVATDGEVILLTTPLHYRVRPGALRVIVPKQAASDE
ncbi:MAG: diacylglycerol kinase family lipid kinase [Acidobacteria bacterium]|nr:diacylglycerol kinase family lipid kinase [Acidobacteriota bacterium]